MQNFLIMLLICSITVSALILLYMAVTPLLAKRYSVTSRYYAWLILVIGLMIPFRPQFAAPFVSVHMPGKLPGNISAPVIRVGNAVSLTVPASAEAVLPSALPDPAWWQAAAAVWLGGILLFLAYHGIKHYRFLKLMARWSEDITDQQTLELLESITAQMGVTKKPCLQVCDAIGSPMLTGFGKPRIILPNTDFSIEELRFILKHELVHYRRKDLWYKCLVLTASAIHWFNPIVYLMVKAIDIQCELSCDAEVVRSEDSDTRLSYSKTIIGVIQYKSRMTTALSTHFYGGKKGMKSRIFSIMDMKKKKAGLSILCAVFMLTLGTGAVLAANTDTPKQPEGSRASTGITPWISGSFFPDPAIYGKYADFGITISDDGTQLLYNGQAVRLFADEKSDTEAFYLNGSGSWNLSVNRDAAGKITEIERISEEKAKEYQDTFFAEEYSGSVPKVQDIETVHETVQETVQVGSDKYDPYQPFGVTYSAADASLYFKKQRVKFFIDQPAGGSADVLWTDDAGTVNLAVVRDTSGRITSIESISEEKAKEYQSAADNYAQIDEDALEKQLEKR